MKILIVRVSSLGDLIHNMPLVHDLQRHYPAAKIDWVVEEAYTGLVALCPGLHRIIPVALRRWRKQLFCAATWQQIGHFYRSLKLESYDLVFDTQGLLKTGLIMKIARLGANGKRIGLANATADSGYEALSRIFHTHSIAIDFRTHAVERSRIVAAKAGGYTVDQPPQFDLQTPVLVENLSTLRPELARCLETSHYLVFFHASANPKKSWPAENWISLGKQMAIWKLPIFLPWGNATEKAAAEQLATHIPTATILPSLSVTEAAAMVQRATLVIGIDTGLTHLAAAFKRPTIELYCASPRWKTEGNWSSWIINLGEDGQPPTVADVQHAAFELLMRTGLTAPQSSLNHFPASSNPDEKAPL